MSRGVIDTARSPPHQCELAGRRESLFYFESIFTCGRRGSSSWPLNAIVSPGDCPGVCDVRDEFGVCCFGHPPASQHACAVGGQQGPAAAPFSCFFSRQAVGVSPWCRPASVILAGIVCLSCCSTQLMSTTLPVTGLRLCEGRARKRRVRQRGRGETGDNFCICKAPSNQPRGAGSCRQLCGSRADRSPTVFTYSRACRARGENKGSNTVPPTSVFVAVDIRITSSAPCLRGSGKY